MIGYYKKVFNELENQINELLFEQENQLTTYEQVIEVILQKMTKLKEYVLKTFHKLLPVSGSILAWPSLP